MDKNGVKVTYIDTQFVTSDAASFKSLEQRLTGKSAVACTGPCRAGIGAGPDDGRSAVTGSRSYYMSSAASVITAAADVRVEATAANSGVAGQAAQPSLDELHAIWDFSELFYVVSASEPRHGGSCADFTY